MTYRLQHKTKRFFQFLITSLISIVGLNLLPLPQKTKLFTRLEAAPINTFSQQSFVAKALARSGAAVVTLETQRTVISHSQRNLPPGLLLDPYLREFFGIEGINSPRSRIERGQGSGVIFADEGLVLTNAHVVEKTDQLIVGLSNGERVPGEVVGQDSLTDLAVIRLQGAGPWPTAPLGNSDKLFVGDWAIAVGNPYGLENTVTLGIISNLNRNFAQLGIGDKRLNLIQTDAAINPGNSGGPLLNSAGEVIGINTLVRSGPGAGLGFAIPINRAREIAKQLVENGRASHPMIGISLADIESNTKGQKNFISKGAIVRYIIKGGPAERGGMKIGDVIIAANKQQIKNPAEVVNEINKSGVGKPIEFTVIRSNRKLNMVIIPIEMRNIRMKQ